MSVLSAAGGLSPDTNKESGFCPGAIGNSASKPASVCWLSSISGKSSGEAGACEAVSRASGGGDELTMTFRARPVLLKGVAAVVEGPGIGDLVGELAPFVACAAVGHQRVIS